MLRKSARITPTHAQLGSYGCCLLQSEWNSCDNSWETGHGHKQLSTTKLSRLTSDGLPTDPASWKQTAHWVVLSETSVSIPLLVTLTCSVLRMVTSLHTSTDWTVRENNAGYHWPSVPGNNLDYVKEAQCCLSSILIKNSWASASVLCTLPATTSNMSPSGILPVFCLVPVLGQGTSPDSVTSPGQRAQKPAWGQPRCGPAVLAQHPATCIQGGQKCFPCNQTKKGAESAAAAASFTSPASA